MDFTECWSDTCSNVAIAARIGNIEILRSLLKQKKAVDVSDNRGWKPLHEAAAISPSILCLEELLKHENTDINWVTHEGETALLLACKRRNCSTDVGSVVKLLLEYGADPNIQDNEEDSPLLAAVRGGLGEVVDLLIEAGANVDSRDCSKWSPLHEAASKNNLSVLQSLLKKGAQIDKKDECGMTPIFTAAQHGAESCLQELLSVAKERGQENSVNVGAEDWATPLMIAAQQGFVNCVKLLLEYGANPDLKTADQATALHLAVQGNHNQCLGILLEKMDLQPIIRMFHPLTYDASGMISPLHLAVEYSSYECLKSLLAAGFSPDSLFESVDILTDRTLPLPKTETALSYAVSKQSEVSIAILLAAGASCNPPVDRAFHPLLRAMRNPTMEEFHILIESGANVNYRRQQNPTNEAFLYCLLTNKLYLKPLLYYGCDPNMCFENGHEVFSRCCFRYLRMVDREFLADCIKFLLRFLIITKNVQTAFRLLVVSTRCPSDVRDILELIDRPSSLKQICFVKLRQHLYHIHGTNFPNILSRLPLPPLLEEYVACRDLQFPSVDEPLIINSVVEDMVNQESIEKEEGKS